MNYRIHEYKESLKKRLEEYMSMPVNAHNVEIVKDTADCLEALKEYCRDGEETPQRSFPAKHGGKLTRRTAEEWVDSMRNTDGSDGERWSYEQTEAVREKRDCDCEGVEFYAAMNMMRSDYYRVARKYGIDTPDFYADLAEAFLTDEDAVKDKISRYYECVVEH